MSTTSSIPDYTLVGEVLDDYTSVACLLLNRGGKHERETVVKALVEQGMSYIVSVEQRQHFFEVESLCDKFPILRFLLFDTIPNVGLIINLVSEITNSDYLAVTWNDTETTCYRKQELVDAFSSSGTYLLAPVLKDYQEQVLPQLRVPAYEDERFVVRADYAVPARRRTLYAPDYVGVYRCSTLTESGGFDVDIPHAFWQQVDLGLRMYRRGMEAVVSEAWQLQYRETPPPEDQSETHLALRCHLKNIAPTLRGGGARLPFSAFWKLLLRWRLPFFATFHVYRDLARWVRVSSAHWRLTSDAVIRKFSQSS